MFIDDPHNQPNLVPQIETGIDVVRIINQYRYSRYPEDKAYCAKCQAKRHRDGFTVELEDGTWALLGSKCGGDLWGEPWQGVTARFYEEVERAGVRSGADVFLPELHSVRVGLEDWREIVTAFVKHQRVFSKELPAAFRKLKAVADTEDQRLPAPNSLFEGLSSGRLSGGLLFTAQQTMDHFERGLLDIDEIIRSRSSLSGRDQINLVFQRSKLVDACRHLNSVAAALRSVVAFYAPDNLRRVALWLSLVLQENSAFSVAFEGMWGWRPRYEALSSGIRDNVTSKKIERPSDWRLHSAEALRRLEKLDCT
jgi:hypothetical protein